MKRTTLHILLFLAFGFSGFSSVGQSAIVLDASLSQVFINELHYDNASYDTLEGVEIVGPAGTDLGCYQLYFYNGINGSEYDFLQLSGLIPNQSCGVGAVWFPFSSIQNGGSSVPDGLALYNMCTQTSIQFLSYEGQFITLEEPFLDVISQDIGVSETTSTPSGYSLQLEGVCSLAMSFDWASPQLASPGYINPNQSFCYLDVELSSINLSSGCILSENEEVILELINHSTMAFDTLILAFSFDQVMYWDTLIQNIEPQQDIEYTFDQTLDLQEEGDYVLDIWIALGSDIDAWNDSLNSYSIILTQADSISINHSYTESICGGETVTLSAENFGANNYAWNNGATSPSLYVEVEISSTYSLVLSNECFTDSSIFTIEVLNLPLDLGQDISICEDESITLEVPDYFEEYLWSDGSNGQQLDVAQAGTYYIEVVDSFMCSSSDSIIVAVSLPNVQLGNDTVFCEGETFLLNASSDFATYNWSTGETTQNIFITQAGTYSVEVLDVFGCVDQDTISLTTIKCDVGLNVFENQIKIYPNPLKNDLFIYFPSDQNVKCDIEVYDLLGKLIFCHKSVSLTQKISLLALKSGVYLLKIKSSSLNFSQKIHKTQ